MFGIEMPQLTSGELLALYYIFNVMASNMPAPNGNVWYRFLYQCVQTIAANWENFRERGVKNVSSSNSRVSNRDFENYLAAANAVAERATGVSESVLRPSE